MIIQIFCSYIIVRFDKKLVYNFNDQIESKLFFKILKLLEILF